MFKRILALLLAIMFAFGLTAFAASASPGSTGGGGSENYYQAVSELVASNWDDAFFDTATLSVGGETLDVDGKTIKLDNKAEIAGDELIMPLEVFTALGAQTSFDSESVVVEKNGANIEIKYGENSIKINGNKKGMPAAAAIKNGKPVLPSCVLGDLGLGFEISYDNGSGEITITNEYQMARLAVKVKPGKTAPNDIGAVQAIAGPDGLYVLQFETGEKAQAACEALNVSSNVVFAEPDRLVMLETEPAYEFDDDDYYIYPIPDEPVYLPYESPVAAAYTHLGWGPGRIGSDLYLDYLISNGKQNAAVVVAVLDTGLDSAHPYFAGRHIPGYNFINAGAAPSDVHSHGTHVAGTIVDVTIALPNVKIMPVKVLGDDGRGSSLTVSNGIRWAADNGAKVINMSLGGSHSQTEDDSVMYAIGKNVTVVVAAGNETDDAKNHCPAHIPAVITVASFDSSNRPASSSNYGECVDVAAPGVGIISTIPGGRTGSMSGTSMASPHVAGSAAMLLCDTPSLSPASVKAVIRYNVDPITTGGNRYYGTGILNIGKAAGVVAPQFIIVTPTSVVENVYSGLKQKQLTVEYYNNGTITNITSQATYLSNNANVATVNNSGLITVRSAGSASVAVGYNGSSATVQVTGVSLAPMAVLSSIPSNGNTNVNVATTISVTFNYQIIRAISFTLVDNSGRNISWSSQLASNPAIITLSEKLRPFTEYTFTIPVGGAVSANGALEQAYTMKFVTGEGDGSPILVTSVTLPSAASINVAGTTTLTATVLPTNASNKTLTWSSSNTSVATVNSDGVVLGVAAGTATITARSTDGSNRSGSCAVTVTLPPTGVTVTPGEATLAPNATRQLTATVTPTNAINTITWSSSNTAVATVSTTGLVTARVAGTATITARTINGLTATCLITVPDTIAPVITLTGGSTVTINRGNAYVEPGYRAVDNVDGDITSKVVVSGSVDTSIIGAYRLTYSATDMAGNTGTATRTINVVANRASYSFSDKGKAGASFNHNFTASFPAIATINATGVDSKTQVTISIKDSAGKTVFSSPFSTTAAKTTELAAGSYTLTIRIDSANGNATVGANLSLAEIELPTAPTLSSIEAAPSSLSLTIGASQTVSVTAVYSDGSRVAVTSGASLSSSNTGVATVSGMTVRAVAAGSATVTASYEGKTATIPVTVAPQAPTAPTVALIGSAQIVLHLGGSPYIEQGVTATDALDGNIGSSAVIDSNVDTTKAGNYTVKYTVTNSAGLSVSVTRQVSVIAPQTRTVPGRSYSFAPKGKQGETFTYNADADLAGNMSLSVTVPNKTTTTVRITNSAGSTVSQETFTANTTRSIPVSPGRYTIRVSIDAANGNATINLGLTTPPGTETYFPQPEVPM